MTSLKTLLFGTTLAAGAAFFMGTTAHADEAYTVQSGDTLSTISQKYVGDNSLINAIAESNSISDINLIYSGQQLTIPTEGSTQAAAEPQAKWIAQKESSGSYTATNGRYIGRYQLDSSYLNGDYSAANQEKVAEQYVASRYGSWEAAKAFWEANGWY
ncbi:LysM peptidoglycan-binding domain-containing protein [Enterococcus lactis]|uniref:aggregation-promoting factor n=1 Tax=Enterococcus lactis TaxID=357441 RepID=UPI0022E5A43C|nr:LysM peptidoglycan-binding domain-containing protein [Enterococcus lactis]